MTTFQGNQRAKALAAWGAVGGAGAAIGVLVGGLLTEFGDWRLIFYVNLPVAVVLAIAAIKIVPADGRKPRWRGLDLRGAALVTTSLGAIVFAITQGEAAGWTSLQTLLFGFGGLAGLSAFAVLERHTVAPLLRIERLADRAVGGGVLLDARGGRLDLRPLPAQLALPAERPRHGAALDRPRLHPARARSGSRRTRGRSHRQPPRCARAARRCIRRRGRRHDAPRPRRRDRQLRSATSFPGMLVAGLGLGVAIVSVSIAILTGAREEETGMISGLSSTGHEIGGTLGIAIFSTIAAGAGALAGPQAASGISHAFIAAAILASLASLVALAVLPGARHFVAKLRLNPLAMPTH